MTTSYSTLMGGNNNTNNNSSGGVDLTSLLSDLGSLESQLVNASRQISLHREHHKSVLLVNTSTDPSSINSATLGGSVVIPPLPRPVILPCEGFRVEDGSENPRNSTLPAPTTPLTASVNGTLGNGRGTVRKSTSSLSLNSSLSGVSSLSAGTINSLTDKIEKHILVENAEQDTAWYFKYFLGKTHHNFVGQDDQKLPYVLSVLAVPEEEENEAGTTSGNPHIRAILWRRNVRMIRLLLSLSLSLSLFWW
jgi:hypothetical protein